MALPGVCRTVAVCFKRPESETRRMSQASARLPTLTRGPIQSEQGRQTDSGFRRSILIAELDVLRPPIKFDIGSCDVSVTKLSSDF